MVTMLRVDERLRPQKVDGGQNVVGLLLEPGDHPASALADVLGPREPVGSTVAAALGDEHHVPGAGEKLSDVLEWHRLPLPPDPRAVVVDDDGKRPVALGLVE